MTPVISNVSGFRLSKLYVPAFVIKPDGILIVGFLHSSIKVRVKSC